MNNKQMRAQGRLFFAHCSLLFLVGLMACQPTAVPELPTAVPTATRDEGLGDEVQETIPQSTIPISQAPTPLPPTAVPQSTIPTPQSTTAVPQSPTPSPSSPLPTPSSPLPSLLTINGLAPDQFLLLPPEVMANVRRIWAEGQALGRNSHAFSKLGDSVVATPAFLTPFGRVTHYHLGDYEALQPAIEQFGGSWLRYGVAIRPGLQARSVFDPFWADKEWCEPNETVLDCEIRLNKPAFLLIHLGANDENSGFGRQLELIALRAIELGVVPILITKADRFEGEDNRNNLAIRQVAADHHLPLLDFDLLAGTIPLRGLRDDEVHLSAVPSGIYDYRDPATWETGQAVQNLAILFMFDALWEIVRSD